MESQVPQTVCAMGRTWPHRCVDKHMLIFKPPSWRAGLVQSRSVSPSSLS